MSAHNNSPDIKIKRGLNLTKTVFINAAIATLQPGGQAYGLIRDAGLVIQGGKIIWLGERNNLPEDFQNEPLTDLGGRLVTPSMIDCHTHIVYGGNRAQEFEMYLKGASYEDVARAGGGIVSTVAATRAASEDELLESALKRVDHLLREGVGHIEIKSGYGLNIETEMKMLRAAAKIEKLRPVRVSKTYLAAHALPPEYKDRADAYIDEVCIPGLTAAHEAGLVDAVDGFCEGIGFNPAQIERVFRHAKSLNVPVKLHAEQLSNLGGAALAARYDGLSADHLEYLDGNGVAAMAQAGTAAVILPGAFYYLGETQKPPIDKLRDKGVPMAVATDCNPGSSPMTSLLLAMNMACTLFKLTPEEALIGTTRAAAWALGAKDSGHLAAGMRADFAIWDAVHPAELSYRIGFNPLYQRYFEGELCTL